MVVSQQKSLQQLLLRLKKYYSLMMTKGKWGCISHVPIVFAFPTSLIWMLKAYRFEIKKFAFPVILGLSFIITNMMIIGDLYSS
jgi:hypothetical protein